METPAATTSPAEARESVLGAVGIPRSDHFTWAAIDVDGEDVRLHYDLDGVGRLTERFTFHQHDVGAVADRADVAGALPLTGLTALRVLETLAVTKGESVLVHAASGGVGYLACQLAVAAGAHVVGTASPAKHERLREIGVTPVAHGDGLQERLRDVAPEGFDAVADLVGGVLDTSLAVLRDGGRIASVADPAVEEHGGRWVWVRPDGERLAGLLEEVAGGRLHVRIDTSYPLKRLADAFGASRDGSADGKIVIDVAD